MVIFLNRNPLVEVLEESSLGAARLIKGACPDNLAGSPVGDAEHDGAAFFIGKCDTILDQLLEVKAT